ncbi:MarR family transcriptional regulator [Proteus mirabilis]|nr:MarR family transcriptional regulator [Proteus mirabilis]MBG6049042.1 MarR family transcriptional regulator [Proteus mirabilis]
MNYRPGLGELLRYVTELVDNGSDEAYRIRGISCRPRYTPVLRAIKSGAKTVNEITNTLHFTQGAISQTVSLMEKDGIIVRNKLSDGRSAALVLTTSGTELLRQLEQHWDAIFKSIDALEADVGLPVIRTLEKLAQELERIPFSERIIAVSDAGVENT